MKPICHICNKEMIDIVYLAKHLRKHKISTKDYYDRYFKKDGEGICYCGKETKFFTLEKGYLKYCGYKCSSNAVEVKEKHVSTCIERYGVNNVNLIDGVRDKHKQTLLKNYGVTSPLKSTCIQNKRIKTLVENYGVSIPLRSQHIMEKKKSTCLKNYGVENSFSSSNIRNKIKQSCIKHFGKEYSFQSDIVKDKIKKTMVLRYGVENPGKSKVILDRSKQTCLNKYGVEYIFQIPYVKKICRANAIKRIEIQKLNGEPLIPHIGFNERLFLNELQKYTNYNIIRNDHSFAYNVARFPDGHISELKLFIQFDERRHFKDKECTIYQDDDIQCTKDLESIPGYRVFRVSELDWNNNKSKVISDFLKYLTIEV